MALNLKESFGPGDITAVAILPGQMLVLEEVTNVSISTHFDKEPIRRLGHSLPVGWATGAGSIAGTLVCAQMTHGALWKVRRYAGTIREFQGDALADVTDAGTQGEGPRTVVSDVDAAAASILPQQLPPFHIMLVHQNDSGQMALARLYDVTFTDHSEVKGAQNKMTEEDLQYQALYYEQLQLRQSLSTPQMQELLNEKLPEKQRESGFFNDIREPQLVDELKDLGSVNSIEEYLVESTEEAADRTEATALGIADTGNVIFVNTQQSQTPVYEPETQMIDRDEVSLEPDVGIPAGSAVRLTDVYWDGTREVSVAGPWLVRLPKNTGKDRWHVVGFDGRAGTATEAVKAVVIEEPVEDAAVLVSSVSDAGELYFSTSEYEAAYDSDLMLEPGSLSTKGEVVINLNPDGENTVYRRWQLPTMTTPDVTKYEQIKTGTYASEDERFVSATIEVGEAAESGKQQPTSAQVDVGNGFYTFNITPLDNEESLFGPPSGIAGSRTAVLESTDEGKATLGLEYQSPDGQNPRLKATREQAASGASLAWNRQGDPDNVPGLTVTKTEDSISVVVPNLTDGNGNALAYRAKKKPVSGPAITIEVYESSAFNTVKNTAQTSFSSGSAAATLTPGVEARFVSDDSNECGIGLAADIITAKIPESFWLVNSAPVGTKTIYETPDSNVYIVTSGGTATGRYYGWEFSSVPVTNGALEPAKHDLRLSLEGPFLEPNTIVRTSVKRQIADLANTTMVELNEIQEA